MANASILDVYVRNAPSPQNAVDLFKGEWITRLPPPYEDLTGAAMAAFQDGRITWALQELGGVQGQNVLELGPMEGEHSYMLEQAGAAQIQAVEANSRAFLKCLIAKEILGMSRVQFQLGDFMPFLESAQQQYDMILASGVLYHMKDPLRLLSLISQHTRRTYLWTHYYDDAIINANPTLRVKFRSSKTFEVDGVRCGLHRQEYQNNLRIKGFCGGSEDYSYWLKRQDLLNALAHHGFNKVTIGFEMPLHPHGPCLCVAAAKA